MALGGRPRWHSEIVLGGTFGSGAAAAQAVSAGQSLSFALPVSIGRKR